MLDLDAMMLRPPRLAWTFVVSIVLLSPACVVSLSARNEPLTNGGVTGELVDCSQVTPLGIGSISTGPAQTKLVGRYDTSDPAVAKFDWSGNVMSARFQGTTEVSVGLSCCKDADGNDVDADIIFEAKVDDLDPFEFTVSATTQPPSYTIATNLAADQPHEITIMRNTEPQKGITQFTGFNFGSGVQLPPTIRPRRIEIIGDSITCGYGNMGNNASCPYDEVVDPTRPDVRVPVTENEYLAYGSIAARTLSADAVILCYSGKGVVLNLNDKAGTEPTTTMPQYYERTICNDPTSQWDFGGPDDPEPQVVVINLGTNDFSRDNNLDGVPDGIDLDAFQAGYLTFVRTIRQHRPNAHIFLAVSPMLTDQYPLANARTNQRNVLGNIVNELNAENDTKVYRIEFVEQGTRYGLGCDYHPNLTVHGIMADQLVGAIRSKTCWQ
ncbi:MAG: GDSL-type esterase/lipase family protein [Polyangiaceae bacterium]|nr:GDSL-type esterase/lipase family protein [Polyangiaceae bacterium]